MMHPTEAIDAGRKILDQVLISAGFVFAFGDCGHGSGGTFSTGAYVKNDRKLAFSFRWALGAVEYHVGEDCLDHNLYMRLLDVYDKSEFSRFSRDVPLAGFYALRHDLEHFCSDFVLGSGEEIQRLLAQQKTNCYRA
jgi:hypothetical protein